MNKLIIYPKSHYVVGLIILSLFICIIAYLLYRTHRYGEDEALVIVSIFNFIIIVFIFWYLNKVIYCSMDKNTGLFTYGNLFLKEQIPLENVTYKGRIFLIPTMACIKIGQSIYWTSNRHVDLKDLLSNNL